jgi:hypothetical protein
MIYHVHSKIEAFPPSITRHGHDLNCFPLAVVQKEATKSDRLGVLVLDWSHFERWSIWTFDPSFDLLFCKERANVVNRKSWMENIN